MKSLRFSLVLAFLMMAFTGASAWAQEITIEQPWARASAGMARAGAAFFVIANTGPADRLVAAKAAVSQKVELHTHMMDQGIMKMRQVPAIDVPAHGKVELKPGSFHVMFMGLNQPLIEGSQFPVTLIFEKAQPITIQVQVQGVGAMSDMGHTGNMKH